MHSEGYDNGDLLMAVSKEMFLKWIMDAGGLYHMTRRRNFLFDFKEFNVVLLGDNRACAIRGTGKTESGEASVGIQKKESLAQVWHKRLGHISEAGLHELERREVMGNKGLESFWAEATMTTTYLINRSPSITLEKNTPKDLWSGYVRDTKIHLTMKFQSLEDVRKVAYI
nr:hypothetical protein [Tanacetum cinerariifolium]